jgi:hypothetical protein
MVFFILIEMTTPLNRRVRTDAKIGIDTYLKIIPLMLTSPVKGHFLSMKAPLMADWGVLKPITY